MQWYHAAMLGDVGHLSPAKTRSTSTCFMHPQDPGDLQMHTGNNSCPLSVRFGGDFQASGWTKIVWKPNHYRTSKISWKKWYFGRKSLPNMIPWHDHVSGGRYIVHLTDFTAEFRDWFEHDPFHPFSWLGGGWKLDASIDVEPKVCLKLILGRTSQIVEIMRASAKS